MEDALLDIEPMRTFAGIKFGIRRIPDETAVPGFRRQQGMDRVLSQCPDRFAHMVNLPVLALNVHLLGLKVRERIQEERKLEAKRKLGAKKAAWQGAFRNRERAR